jgi:GDSL-like lipase/acylhydrolase family protein
MPDDFMRMCEEQPSGVHLVFRSAASRVELDVRVWRTVSVNRWGTGSDGPVPAARACELTADGEVVARADASTYGTYRLDFGTRRATLTEAPVCTLVFDTLPGREAEIAIWLPHDEVATVVALRTDAPSRPPAARSQAQRWVHHGSSISHGACADSPTGTWPVVAARRAGLDLLNLGFGGNAVLDPYVAGTIRDLDVDLITLKLGINLVNGDLMRVRALRPAVEGFLDTIRQGHPTTPIIVISPILCPMVEDLPGPTDVDPASPDDAPTFRTLGHADEVAQGKLSLRVIRDVLAEVVERRRSRGDAALGYLDGLRLYGEPEWRAMPMPDLLHPDPVGQRHIGDRFAALLPEVLASLGVPTGVAAR